MRPGGRSALQLLPSMGGREKELQQHLTDPILPGSGNKNLCVHKEDTLLPVSEFVILDSHPALA